MTEVMDLRFRRVIPAAPLKLDHSTNLVERIRDVSAG